MIEQREIDQKTTTLSRKLYWKHFTCNVTSQKWRFLLIWLNACIVWNWNPESFHRRIGRIGFDRIIWLSSSSSSRLLSVLRLSLEELLYFLYGLDTHVSFLSSIETMLYKMCWTGLGYTKSVHRCYNLTKSLVILCTVKISRKVCRKLSKKLLK